MIQDFFKPKWYKLLPIHFQNIKVEIIKKLEDYRKVAKISHPTFSEFISITPWAVVQLQYSVYSTIRNTEPNLTEKEVWKYVILSRLNVKLQTVNLPIDAYSNPMSREEINKIIATLDEHISQFKTFEDVIRFILKLDYEENRFYDTAGIIEKINSELLELNVYNESAPIFSMQYNCEASYNEGLSRFDNKEYKEAINFFTNSIMLDKKNYVYFLYRGTCFFNINDIRKAINDYNTAIELNPKCSDAYMYRGSCYYYLRDSNLAKEDFQKATNLGSKDAKYLLESYFPN